VCPIHGRYRNAITVAGIIAIVDEIRLQYAAAFEGTVGATETDEREVGFERERMQ